MKVLASIVYWVTVGLIAVMLPCLICCLVCMVLAYPRLLPLVPITTFVAFAILSPDIINWANKHRK